MAVSSFALVSLVTLCILHIGIAGRLTKNKPKAQMKHKGHVIQCPACTNLTGYPGAKTCNSEKDDIITCHFGLDSCMTVNAVMTVPNVSVIPFQLKNCSNSILCDPDSEYYLCKMLKKTGYVSSCFMTCTKPSNHDDTGSLGASEVVVEPSLRAQPRSHGLPKHKNHGNEVVVGRKRNPFRPSRH